jgi:hypothetical protein
LFTDTLPGRCAPLDFPGGAAKVGRVGPDTGLMAGYRPETKDRGVRMQRRDAAKTCRQRDVERVLPQIPGRAGRPPGLV